MVVIILLLGFATSIGQFFFTLHSKEAKKFIISGIALSSIAPLVLAVIMATKTLLMDNSFTMDADTFRISESDKIFLAIVVGFISFIGASIPSFLLHASTTLTAFPFKKKNAKYEEKIEQSEDTSGHFE